jgi:hypothetical protein
MICYKAWCQIRPRLFLLAPVVFLLREGWRDCRKPPQTYHCWSALRQASSSVVSSKAEHRRFSGLLINKNIALSRWCGTLEGVSVPDGHSRSLSCALDGGSALILNPKYEQGSLMNALPQAGALTATAEFMLDPVGFTLHWRHAIAATNYWFDCVCAR